MGRWQRPAGHLRIAIDRDVGDEAEQTRGAVAALGKIKQGRRGVDEAGGDIARDEIRVIDDVFQEGDIGRDAADAKLAQRPIHPPHSFFRRRCPGGDLFQQAVEIARDHGAGISRAAIQPDAETRSAAISSDAAIIRGEIILRVFRGDPALQGVTVQHDFRLFGDAGLRLDTDMAATGDLDLGADDVDPGHFLGHGMFDLDARIDLDEIEFAGLGIEQEFHRAGAAISRMAHQAQGGFADRGAGVLAHVRRRRALDDFLVAALDRAVALIEVDQIAMAVAENLDLDMARLADQFFQIDLAIAESGFGFAATGFGLGVQLAGILDHPHATTTAAPAGFQHERIADIARHRRPVIRCVGQGACRGHHRHLGLDGHVTRGDLVAEGFHDIRRRADKGQAGRGTGLGEVGIFRQEAIAGMDKGRAALLGNRDDAVDIEIGLHRTEAGANPIAFIGLEAVQRQLVLFRIDRDRAQAELGSGAHDADGDFTAIGDEEFFGGHAASPDRVRGGARRSARW